MLAAAAALLDSVDSAVVAAALVPAGLVLVVPAILGLFPVNLLHNLAHLILGVWGIVAARSFGGAKAYAQIAGVLYLLLAILGFVDPTTFGMMPIGGADVWLHVALALVLLAAGFTAKEGRAAIA